MSDDLSPAWYVIYRTADGRVLRGGTMPKSYIATYPAGSLPAGTAILEVNRQADIAAGEWVVGGALITAGTLSPTVSATTLDADGVDTVTISGLPNPCRVTITHSAPEITTPAPDTEVTDGTVVVTCILPGTIGVRIVSAGNQTWSGTLNAI